MTIESRPFALREGTSIKDVAEVVTMALTGMFSDVPPGDIIASVHCKENADGSLALTALSIPDPRLQRQ